MSRALGTLRKSVVLLTRKGSANVIQLNRPEKMNCLNIEVAREAIEALETSENDDSKIVIFKGSKEVFSAGGDLKHMIADPLIETCVAYDNLNKASEILPEYKKPYVCLVQGVARGGAGFYFMSARNSVVTEKTTYGMPETGVGYFNDGGSSFFLPRLKNNFGIYLGMTGTVLNGIDMKRIGLISHFVENSKFENLEPSLLNCKSDEDLKSILDEFSTKPDGSKELDEVLNKTEKCFSGSSVEEIVENLKIDGSDWATKTLKVLSRKSPTSLKVTLQNMHKGRNKTLRECLDTEKIIYKHHVLNSDMREGYRALLVDRDNKPKWNPKTLEEVTQEMVDRFFIPIDKF